jgi:hypothetical protein
VPSHSRLAVEFLTVFFGARRAAVFFRATFFALTGVRLLGMGA